MKIRTPSLFLALVLAGAALSVHAQASYRITPVGDQPMAGYALNEKAEVVGSFQTATSVGRPFVWRNGVVVALPWANTEPGEYSEAIDINDKSEIVGFSSDSLTGRFVGAIWRDDQFHELPGFAPTDFVQAIGINNLSQVIGLRNEDWFVWRNGHYSILPPLREGDTVALYEINDLGFAIGQSTSPYTRQGGRAVVWVFGHPINLGTLPGTDFSVGNGINNLAQAVGFSAIENSPGPVLPWLWENGHLIPLPTLRAADGYASSPGRINDHGFIVGGSTPPNGDSTARIATVWQAGIVYDLNALVRADDPLKPYLHLEVAIDVNNKGQILANGRDSRDPSGGWPRLFLLTPVQ